MSILLFILALVAVFVGAIVALIPIFVIVQLVYIIPRTIVWIVKGKLKVFAVFHQAFYLLGGVIFGGVLLFAANYGWEKLNLWLFNYSKNHSAADYSSADFFVGWVGMGFIMGLTLGLVVGVFSSLAPFLIQKDFLTKYFGMLRKII